MTNTEMLRKAMHESGYRLYFIARKLGISYQAFLNKVENKSGFKVDEIQALCELLNLTKDEKEKIFFANL